MHVTVRGDKADELLKRGLRVKEFELRKKNFSAAGKCLFPFLLSQKCLDFSLNRTKAFFGVFLTLLNAFSNFYLFIIIGNFGFGIDEHIDLGIKYDTNTGIFGMDFYVVLGRAGKRVAKRRAKTNKFGKFQGVTAEDAKQWFVEKYGGNVLN